MGTDSKNLMFMETNVVILYYNIINNKMNQ